MAELLFELLSEEIPARMQARAAEDLKRLVCDRLTEAHLDHERACAYVTPRRLALAVEGLPSVQPDRVEERRGPRVGAPDKAIEGFLAATGIRRDQLEVRELPKGTFLFAALSRKGRPAADVLAEVLQAAVAEMSWPKSMRWGRYDLRWVRPLLRVLAVFEGKPLGLAIARTSRAFSAGTGTDGPRQRAPLIATNRTVGHRFLAPEEIEVADVSSYRSALLAAKVVVDQRQRREIIEKQIERLATAEGLSLRDDQALLDEVAGLLEWPVAHIGWIDEAYMEVPPEVLVTSMRAHQKYFSLVDAAGALAPRFIVVAGTETSDGGREVVAGNERVLRARLADAKYFWDNDRKRRLEERTGLLANRVFHARLGSDLERAERIGRLARTLAPRAGADPDQAARAGRLCKADLTTEMVGEFPELQGVMGRYYALHDGEAAAVAEAIGDHYAPQGPRDRCPTAPVSVAVALADKIDTLAGFFGIDEKPTGGKDPFALRRAALGSIRLIVDNGLRLPLLRAFDTAALPYLDAGSADAASVSRPGWEEPHQQVSWGLLDFFAERLKVELREQGVRHDLISAVFVCGGEDDLVRLLARVSALRDFLNTDDGANLLTAYRRATNIVRIEEKKDNTKYEGRAQERLLTQAAETELYRALEEARVRIGDLVLGERFGEAMAVLAGLRPPIDAFFDRVTVNCENAQLRVNRLRLLSQIRAALSGVADFSEIEG